NLTAKQALDLARDIREEYTRKEYHETDEADNGTGLVLDEATAIDASNNEAPFILRTEQNFLPMDYLEFLKDNHEKKKGRSYEYFRANVSDLIDVMGYTKGEARQVRKAFGKHFYPTGFMAQQVNLMQGNHPDATYHLEEC